MNELPDNVINFRRDENLMEQEKGGQKATKFNPKHGKLAAHNLIESSERK